MLRDEPFNGGEFRVHILDGKGFVGNVFMRVEARPKPVPAAAPMVDGLHALVAGMTEGFRNLGTLIVQSAAAKTPAPSRGEMLAEMKTMAELLRPPALPVAKDSAQDVLKAAGEMLAMVEKMKPAGSSVPINSDGEISENALLLSVAEKFFTSLAKIKDQNVATVSGLDQPPRLPAPGNDETAAQPINGEDEMSATMRMFLPVLINQAALDGDVDTYANVILDHAGEAQALAFLEAPDWFEKLAAINKNIAPHKDWFSDTREAVIELLRESDDAGIKARAAAIRLTTDAEAPIVTEAAPPVVQ
jgi:hypothetical protein